MKAMKANKAMKAMKSARPMKTMKAMKAMKKPKAKGSRSGKSGRSGWETWMAKKSKVHSPVQTRRAETVSGDPDLSDVSSDVHFECAANEKSTQTVPWIRRLRRARDLQDSTLQQ